MNITICDDEQAQIKYLTDLVRKWAKDCGVFAAVSSFESAQSLLFAYEENKTVDILLLDIQMEELDGVSLARKIRKDNKEVQIIFITGYTEYILDGYEVEALHYLIKPISEEKLFPVLDRARQKLKLNERALTLITADTTARIPLHEIRYIEVQHNYVTIHAKEDTIVKMTLLEIEGELDDRFLRTGRSFIVNLSYVHKTTKTDVVLTDGITVPLSRKFYDAVNKGFINRG